jgi:hypothetical protein
MAPQHRAHHSGLSYGEFLMWHSPTCSAHRQDGRHTRRSADGRRCAALATARVLVRRTGYSFFYFYFKLHSSRDKPVARVWVGFGSGRGTVGERGAGPLAPRTYSSARGVKSGQITCPPRTAQGHGGYGAPSTAACRAKQILVKQCPVFLTTSRAPVRRSRPVRHATQYRKYARAKPKRKPQGNRK